MTAHLEAIRAGLQKESIRKVWAVGKLQTPDGKSWNFHVTTVARGSNGRWFAIDPIMGRPLPIEVWYQAMQQLDSTHTMRLFSTEAKRFLPSAEKKYDRQRLQDEVFNGYYEDTLRLFREESKELLEKTSAD